MLQKAFVKLEEKETEKALAEINPVLDGGKLDKDAVTILMQELSFYPGYRLYEISAHDFNSGLQRYIVSGPAGNYILDGGNAVFSELNQAAPVTLTKNNICDYLRLYFMTVRGPDGFFRVIESFDDIPWYDEPRQTVRRTISSLISPLTVISEKESLYEIDATILYKQCLYSVRFQITQDGLIRPAQEKLLIEELDVKDDLFS